MLPPLQPLQLIPQYREYVWGGGWLRPERVPTAEAWVIYDDNLIAAGPLAGRTLGDVASQYGAALLGQRAAHSPPSTSAAAPRFPLLIKLLDCAQWISLQVHPNDEQARQLEGPGHCGKTEAWHILTASPCAALIAGIQPGVSAPALAESIRNGNILDLAMRRAVQTGDTFLIPPGAIHALGPGLLVYEVQQTSDLTYRVFDWNRPASAGRALHIEKSLAVADLNAVPQFIPPPHLETHGRQLLCSSAYFTLDFLSALDAPLTLDTQGESFHALTVIAGSARLVSAQNELTLERFQTALVPAESGEYMLEPMMGTCRALVASA